MSKGKDKARRKFVEDWSQTICAQAGVDFDHLNPAATAYVELAVAQCMDAAIQHRNKLDIGADDGYVLRA